MAGYKNFSMSWNAIDCYDQDIKPLSKWLKQEVIDKINNEINEKRYNIDIKLISKLNKNNLFNLFLSFDSWHHTGKMYKKTNFYAFNDSKLFDLTNEKIIELLQQQKQEKKNMDVEEKKYCKAHFLEWGGTRKHPKAYDYEENGYILGNWFYRSNGRKKSVSANGFYVIEYYQRE